MRPFDYRAPASIDEAVSLLAEKGDRARPLAGGTDLLVQLRQRRCELDLLVDVKRIPELNRISFSLETGLTIGAAVSCAQLVEHTETARAYPGLMDAVSIIGGAAVRGRATIAGNLCNAAPSGDAIPALIVLGATCRIAGSQGTRVVPVHDFCVAPGQTALQRGEMLVSIHVPPPQPNSGAAYARFIPRHEMDIAVAGAGTWVRLAEDGLRIENARVALASVAPIPLFVRAAGMAIVGQPLTKDTFARAAALAQVAAKPITDVRGTEAQRRHLVGVLVRRALCLAVQRAKGETAPKPNEGEQTYG